MKTRIAVLAVVVCVTAAVAVSAGGAVFGDASLRIDRPAATYPSAVTITARSPEASGTPTAATFQIRTKDATTFVDCPDGERYSDTGQWSYIAAPNAKNADFRVVIDGRESAEMVYLAVHVPMSKPSVSTTTVRAGRTLRLAGTIRPRHPIGGQNIKLEFQKYDARAKKWRGSRETTVSPTSHLDNDITRWTHSFITKKSQVGKWRVRSFHECVRHTASRSAWRYYRIVR